jgi:hypothetical protein
MDRDDEVRLLTDDELAALADNGRVPEDDD